jgi:hypothetical protein
MRKVGLALTCACVLLATVPAFAETPLSAEQQQIRDQIKKLLDKLPPNKRPAVLSGFEPAQKSVVTDPGSVALAKGTATDAKTATSSTKSTEPTKTDAITAFLQQNAKGSSYQKDNCQGFGFLLRQDWKDMGYSTCASTVDQATGAQFSYSDDLVANNRSWLVHGTAAVLYSSETANKRGEYDFYRTSFGSYVTVNRLLNSAVSQTKNNADTQAFGGLAIFALATPEYGTHWFRLRGGGVDDNIKGTTSANVTGEWSPVYDKLYIHFPYTHPFGLPLLVRFDPELVAQYDRVTGSNQLLQFNNDPEAFRLGPQFSIKLSPSASAPPFLQRFTGSATYHWAYETYTRGHFNWFQSSLTYNLDQAGNFGLTGGYSRGQDEDTGAATNLFKLALSGKI